MPESYFQLPPDVRREALEVAAQHLGRPTVIVEKDIHVVWALSALERAPFGHHVVFKGGTSLSKAYALIDRFSEDVDLTYDLRALAPDLVATGTADGWPRSRTQADRWSAALRERLGTWVTTACAEHFGTIARDDGVPIITDTVVDATRHQYDILLRYEPVSAQRIDYVVPSVKLEFGARGTGEPNRQFAITTDASMTPALAAIVFPQANVTTLEAERTFWEKATATHAYCVRASFRGAHGFARHWYDLARMHASPVGAAAIRDRALARAVARWKGLFVRERGVDYASAVEGHLQVVPRGDALHALQDDYVHMREAGLMLADAPSFDAVLASCADLEVAANDAASQRPRPEATG